jgi:hypothetical protein
LQARPAKGGIDEDAIRSFGSYGADGHERRIRAVPDYGLRGLTLGANGVVLFRQPSFSGSTSSFVVGGACNIPNGVFNCALISDEQAFSGTQSLKVAWQFRTDANGNPFPRAWLRLTTNNTTSVPNPAINFDHRVRVRLYVPSARPTST